MPVPTYQEALSNYRKRDSILVPDLHVLIAEGVFGRGSGRREKGDHDVKAMDGCTEYGQRRITKAGTFQFFQIRWQHDDLKPLAGFRVGVCIDDYWCSGCSLWWPRYPQGRFFMRLTTAQHGTGLMPRGKWMGKL